MATILVVGSASSAFAGRAVIGARAGHAIHLFSDTGGAVPGATLHHAPLASLPALGGVARAAALQRLLERLRPDLVHVHFASQGLAALVLARHPRLIVSVMGGDVLRDQPMLRRAHKRRLLRHLLNAAQLVTTKSAFLDRAVCRWGDHGHKLRRIVWGVDLTRFRPDAPGQEALRRRLRLDPGDLIVLCVRAATPTYEKIVSLRAFARAAREVPRARLLMVEQGGEPAYLERLRAIALEEGVYDRVRWLGGVAPGGMPAHLALADVVVSVPNSDGLPHSVLEAMASGSPLVLSDLPQLDELHQAGLVAKRAPVGAVESLGGALVSALRDADWRAAAATANRALAAQIADQEREAERMNALYEELL